MLVTRGGKKSCIIVNQKRYNLLAVTEDKAEIAHGLQ